MKSQFRTVIFFVVMCAFGNYSWGQSNSSPTSADTQQPASANLGSADTRKTVPQKKKKPEPGKEMGKGGEDIGKGAAKGTGDLAKGTAGAVGHLATGNVGSAGASFGKGAGGLGKNVAVGTGKGVGKIGKGIGGEFKKLGARSKQHDEKS
jgi:hypothetical protein